MLTLLGVQLPRAPHLCLLLLVALPATHVLHAALKHSVRWREPTGSTVGMPSRQLQGGHTSGPELCWVCSWRSLKVLPQPLHSSAPWPLCSTEATAKGRGGRTGTGPQPGRRCQGGHQHFVPAAAALSPGSVLALTQPASGLHSSPACSLRPGLCFAEAQGWEKGRREKLSAGPGWERTSQSKGQAGRGRRVGPPAALCTPQVTRLFAVFALQNERPGAFQFIRLAIQSNWGKSGNTCIYRVQVHGKRRKVVKNSMQLLDKMSEKFPQQCLREKTSFRFPNQVLKPRQKETVKVAIEEIFQNIFYIFSKNLTLAAWDETALGQFQNGLYQQIEQLEACVIKKQTLHFWSKDPNRLKLKKYFKEIDCFLKDKQYSLCSWEISRAEMRRCLQLVDKVVRKLNN
ncbi:uncharacterized protein LOC134166428 isoform X1 [Pezoporus occidentalis]|uniref:uncharacterized protein LOC134166428 isoform X1 n=1 Tax=Pezoporus occidentalis TaxID=407982 RepID=UPI002F91823F